MSDETEGAVDLDPWYSAVLSLVKERMADPFEQRDAEKLSLSELCDTLRGFMREEDIRIPAGTAGKPCFWCREVVYRVPYGSSYGRALSRAITVIDGQAPTDTAAGVGFDHLANCPKSGLRA